MTTKAYLSQLHIIDNQIKDKQLLALQYRENAIMTSPVYSDMKVQTNHKPDKMAESIIKAIEYEKEADDKAVELLNLKHTILEQIDGIKKIEKNNAHVYYNLLMGRYVHNMTMTELQDYVHYGEKQTKRLFDKSIEEFEILYGSEYLEK